eukprot:symbB.v1.2.003623.t1/scaffold203.1/size271217/15
MGDGTEPVAKGLGVNRGHLVQQLLEERRQRLEEKLAATATAVPLIASSDSPIDGPRSPRSLLPSFEIVREANETPRQSFSPGRYQDVEEMIHGSEPSTGLFEQRHCGSRLDYPRFRSASSRSFKERLRESSQQYQQNLDVRRRAQEVELTKHCTFQPAINNRSQIFAQRARGCYAETLPERLGPNDARRRSALREQAKELLQADDLYECTFTPRINAQSDRESRVPLHLRTKAIQQYKQEKIRASQEAKLKQSHPFTPQISARSQHLAQRSRSLELRKRPKNDEVKQDEREDSLQRTFGAGQQTLANPGKASQALFQPQDFLARQKSFEKERRFRKEVREQHAFAGCSFRPRLNDYSEQLTACKVELIGETPEDRIERLAVKDVNRRQLKQQELQQASFNRDCTFRPALSPQSEAIAMSRRPSSPSGIHKRLYDEAKLRSRETSPQRLGDFHPQLDPRSSKRFAHVRPHYSKSEDIMESIRRQQDRRAELLLKRQEERMQAEIMDCTFRPELCKATGHGAPVVVSGLGRFFELKSLAQRQDLEQRAHEAKAFRLGCTHGPPLGITIPEPFALSQSNSWANST